MRIKYFVFFLFFCLLSAVEVQAGNLLERIKNDTFLMDGNVAVLDNGDKKYLISVGIAVLPKQQAPLIRKARLESKVKAQLQLSQFINDAEVQLTEILEETTVTEQNGTSHPTRSINSRYNEFIKELNKGPLTNIITLDTGSIADIYYYILGIELP